MSKQLEIVGRRNRFFYGRTFETADTLVRLNNCVNFSFRKCYFFGPIGPPDPDGQCLQLIRSLAITVEDCDFHAAPPTKFRARRKAEPEESYRLAVWNAQLKDDFWKGWKGPEDLASNFADEKLPWSKEKNGFAVIYRRCRFFGRGTSNSGTSLCLDGPYCPPTLVEDCEFYGARCAITAAGGVGHTFRRLKFVDCKNDLYVHSHYKGAFGQMTFEVPEKNILWGESPGEGNKVVK